MIRGILLYSFVAIATCSEGSTFFGRHGRNDVRGRRMLVTFDSSEHNTLAVSSHLRPLAEAAKDSGATAKKGSKIPSSTAPLDKPTRTGESSVEKDTTAARVSTFSIPATTPSPTPQLASPPALTTNSLSNLDDHTSAPQIDEEDARTAVPTSETSLDVAPPDTTVGTSSLRTGIANGQFALNEPNETETESTDPPGPSFNVPSIERELYSTAVLLKAHSSVPLETFDNEIFAETAEFLTPCLQRAYTDQLQAYKLSVVYTDGPDTAQEGLVVTNMNIKVVISIISSTIEELRGVSHQNADAVVHSCFDTTQLYQYLGALRVKGVDINELTQQDQEFQSPIFATYPPVNAVQSPGQQSSTSKESKKSRVGLIASLCAGLAVLGAVFFAQKRGDIPTLQIPTDRIKHYGASVRKSLKRENLGKIKEFIRGKLDRSESENGSDSYDSDDSDENKTRERTWSGSFRRHPPGGIKPAALQKKPAFSKDYLQSQNSAISIADDYSFSVGGDFNVPDEYDFPATPMSALYTSRAAQQPKTLSSEEEEFSMPEEYNSVREDQSVYSRNMSGFPGKRNPGFEYNSYRGYGQHLAGFPGNLQPAKPQSPNGQSSYGSSERSDPTSISGKMSPKDQHYPDVWSMNSFTTSSPAVTNSSGSGSGGTPPLPYRHWDNEDRGSPGSGLAMPRLM